MQFLTYKQITSAAEPALRIHQVPKGPKILKNAEVRK